MTVEYRNPDAERPPVQRRRRRLWIGCLTGLLLVIAVVYLLIPTLRPPPRGRSCVNTLQAIGQAVQLYAAENGGNLPANLIVLMETQDITPELLTCPSSTVEPARGSTAQEIAASLLQGDHISYAWTGGGLTMTAPADAVIAFDVEDHDRDGANPGINALLRDGRVTFVDKGAAAAIRAQFVTGVRPIRLPTPATAPASSSAQ